MTTGWNIEDFLFPLASARASRAGEAAPPSRTLPLRILRRGRRPEHGRTRALPGKKSSRSFHSTRWRLCVEGRVDFCVVVKVNKQIARPGFCLGGDEFCIIGL